MNLLAQQFAQQPTYQALLCKLLESLSEHFRKSKNTFSQEVTYQKLKQLTDRIGSYFPELYILGNICTKAISTVRIKIDDKFDAEKNALEAECGEQELIDNMMKEFTKKSSMEGGSKNSQKRKVNEEWLKKILIDQLQGLKDDFEQNQELTKQEVTRILTNAISSSEKTFNCLLFDSKLNDKQIFDKIKSQGKANGLPNLRVKVVSTSESVPNTSEDTVSLKMISEEVRKTDAVFISAQCVTINGGVLVLSGGIMVALAAEAYQKPIYIISRGFCLTQRTILGQSTLNLHENPLKYFSSEKRSLDKVYIAKRYDFLDSSILKSIVTELGGCDPVSIGTIFEQYYERI